MSLLILENLHPLIHLIHVLAASMWIGSHLVLITGPLIKTLKSRDLRPTLEFYRIFSWPATIALIIAALTGIYLAYHRAPPSAWWDFNVPSGRIGEKILLFIALLVISAYAHARVIPGMRAGNPKIFWESVAFIILATLMSVGFALIGVMIMYGL